MSKLVPPHGSDTINALALSGDALSAELSRAESLAKITCSSREEGDVVMLGIGGFNPLDGFMGKADWQGICDNMTMENGLFWPIPITLSTDDEDVKAGDDIAIVSGKSGDIIATMSVTEKYTIDKDHECETVYKTTEDAHPGVVMVKAQGKYNLAGPIKVLSDGGFPAKYGDLYMTPAETREYFDEKGWKTVAAFQTRNPIHRAHEYLCKCATEICDGLLIHPLVGETKPGDIPADVRMKCYETIIENYFVPEFTMLSVMPAAMRYAGPREAVLHAVVRQNYGVSHFIVGRDHAGVGDYYGTYDAQQIFNDLNEGDLAVTPLKFEHAAWSNKAQGMVSAKTFPKIKGDQIFLSGTKVRELLAEGKRPPAEFSRPEVADVLIEWATSAEPVAS